MSLRRSLAAFVRRASSSSSSCVSTAALEEKPQTVLSGTIGFGRLARGARGASTRAALDIESANAPEPPTRIEMERRPTHGLLDAVRWVKANAKSERFVESVELAVHLGVDPKRSDMIVRGAVRLPNGTGKTVRVAAFAEGESAEAARAAGASVVGGAELVDAIKEGGSGAIDFDKAVATPGMMSKLKEVARVLGPRGLMPNPKVGTVTTEIAEAVREQLGGRVEFRAEKNAIVHTMVGKVNFEDEQLVENISAVYRELWALRPKGKGAPNASKYVKKAFLSSTMGRGSARLDVNDLMDVSGATR
ncbi:Ribosomal protein L1, 2-layer alpha/beta-sandwich [Ostreococcus tauri]|uniref:Ribosomal protein n=1 Tax=Ostreococcus tauri TaxID=70448 RepID=Q00XM9_OSTTA|nr:Ribosomal protein L1, 2-layer alpha/beta-sandwich [Ostreococcus tauri]CAL57372.1 Ribosomal protein L1, 2-layer alpha/beta-sandwich [Ostreococcus tauri]|eukprot:XP_003082426.1 Ribosomal protein L1, 2-layer alpha/beta-sandwich [Ostreococcus tauri]